jgi:hypothetical protein
VEAAGGQGAVGLGELARLDESRPTRRRALILGHYEAARGLLVEPVHEEGTEAEVALHGLHDGEAHSFARLGGESGRLVQDEYLLVLVERGDHRGRI